MKLCRFSGFFLRPLRPLRETVFIIEMQPSCQKKFFTQSAEDAECF